MTLALFFYFTIPSINFLAVIDEPMFIDAAKAVIVTGKPYISWDNWGYNQDKIFYFHPTTYVDILALIIKIFGESIIFLRGFGILMAVLSSFLVYKLAKLLVHGEKGEKIALLSMFIFLINPLTIKSSLLIEINATVLMPSILLFIHFFIKLNQSNRAIDLFFLGFLMGLVILSKFEGFIFLFPSIILFYYLKNGIRTSFLKTSFISIVGWILFLFSWVFISKIQSVPFFAPFKHNFYTMLFLPFDFNLIKKISYMVWTAKNLFFWTTPTFLLLFFFLAIKRLLNLIKTKKMITLDFLFLFMVILISLSILRGADAYGFPKYFIIGVPFLAIIISNFIINDGYISILIHFIFSRKLTFISILTALFLFNFFILKDPFISHNLFWVSDISFENNLNNYIISNLEGILFFLPLIFLFLLFVILYKHTSKFYFFKRSFVFSCFILLIFNFIYIDSIQSGARYQTTYAYGQTGLENTINFLEKDATSNDIILARGDISYYTKLKNYNYYPFILMNNQEFDKLIVNKKLKYIIINPIDQFYYTSEFLNNFFLIKEEGNFKIYKRKDF